MYPHSGPLKVRGGVVAHKILVSSPVPFLPYWAFELGLTGLGKGLGGLGTKGMGLGLDNIQRALLCQTTDKSILVLKVLIIIVMICTLKLFMM